MNLNVLTLATLPNGCGVVSHPGIFGGEPVFQNTRVPVRFLFEFLLDGGTVAEFVDEHPTVTMQHIEELLTLTPQNA